MWTSQAPTPCTAPHGGKVNRATLFLVKRHVRGYASFGSCESIGRLRGRVRYSRHNGIYNDHVTHIRFFLRSARKMYFHTSGARGAPFADNSIGIPSSEPTSMSFISFKTTFRTGRTRRLNAGPSRFDSGRTAAIPPESLRERVRDRDQPVRRLSSALICARCTAASIALVKRMSESSLFRTPADTSGDSVFSLRRSVAFLTAKAALRSWSCFLRASS